MRKYSRIIALLLILIITMSLAVSCKKADEDLDENGNTVKVFSTTSGEVSLPVAVLISNETQKAAELFACNMKDFNKGLLFGSGNTKGAAMMQEIFELSKGSAVLLTTGVIIPYSGEGFNGTGVSPDYITEASGSSDALGEDGQFLYAVSVLKGEQT